MPKTNVEQETS